MKIVKKVAPHSPLHLYSEHGIEIMGKRTRPGLFCAQPLPIHAPDGVVRANVLVITAPVYGPGGEFGGIAVIEVTQELVERPGMLAGYTMRLPIGLPVRKLPPWARAKLEQFLVSWANWTGASSEWEIDEDKDEVILWTATEDRTLMQGRLPRFINLLKKDLPPL